MASSVSITQVLDGRRGVGVIDAETKQQVFVEVGEMWDVRFGFPWWWARFVLGAAINGLTMAPVIALRPTPGNMFSLEGIFHERFGHGEDQDEFRAKYRWEWIWVVRYLWRMLWCGFNYHGEMDECTAFRLGRRMRMSWLIEGRPRVVTLEMARRWMNDPRTQDLTFTTT